MNDEKVISIVTVSNAVVGDAVRWVFEGPGTNQEFWGSFSTAGDTGMIAELDLSLFEVDQVVGSWTVRILLNEAQVSSLAF